MPKSVKIATRGSRLALTQAEFVQTALQQACPGLQSEFSIIKTSGDKKQGTPLAEVGDKKDWILEIEEAVSRKEADFAVHSGKDVPCDIHPETELLPVLERAAPVDAFLSERFAKFSDLPPGAVVGAASYRRQAQILRLRPDLKIAKVRGNVPTRVSKLNDVDGLVLARAGLDRLGLAEHVRELFTIEDFVPAVNQGTLLVQFRRERADLRELFLGLARDEMRRAWAVERAFVCAIGGDCNSALGVYAEAREGMLYARARVLNHAGTKVIETVRTGPLDAPDDLGQELAGELFKKGARELLDFPHL